MPRFVLLKHELSTAGRADHFDLMLETDAGLLTFELPVLPHIGGEQTVRELPIHRPMYLDYEGPISRDRGQVVQVERGNFEWILRESSELQVALFGDKLRGRLVLTNLSSDPPHWRLRFHSATESSSAESSAPG